MDSRSKGVRVRVRPYKRGSASARRIAAAVGGRCLRLDGSRFTPKSTDIVINWGNKLPYTPSKSTNVINSPSSIPPNKLDFYNHHKSFVPEFTTSQEQAAEWLSMKGNSRVVCRALLNASGGAGITVVDKAEDLIPARVYVKYIKKLAEYRIHFVDNAIILGQQKRMRAGVENANFEVRNHENGFVYCHLDVEVPWQVEELCEELIDTTSLDFGAIDVIYNAKRSKAYILEVNTAPGLEGDTTLVAYAEAFNKLIEQYKESFGALN